jgi:hypothetical protein
MTRRARPSSGSSEVLVIAALFALSALAGDRPHVRDLDRSTVPAGLDYHRGRERLMIDGELVRGSRHAQLDWLGDVAAAAGEPVEELRLEERHRAMDRRKIGAVIAVGAPVAATVTTIVFPPAAALWLPLTAATVGVQGVGVGIGLPAHYKFDRDELAQQVALLSAVETVELPER